MSMQLGTWTMTEDLRKSLQLQYLHKALLSRYKTASAPKLWNNLNK